MPTRRTTAGARTVVSALLLVLAACAGNGETAGGGRTLDVTASFYPLQFVAERVGGDRVDVTNLTPAGAEPHDLELGPRDVVRLGEADLVLYLRGFSPAVDQAIDTEAAGHALDVGPTGLDPDLAGPPGSGPDPHFWLDPTRLATVADELAGRLGTIDPDGAGAYSANAAALRADLEALDAAFRAGLADCASIELVTSHTSFGYLADRYGLTQRGISGLSAGEEPTTAAVAEIADFVRTHGVTTIYTETLIDPAVAETVAAETGARLSVLDPLEGLGEEAAGDDYVAIMRANLDRLRQGQSCS